MTNTKIYLPIWQDQRLHQDTDSLLAKSIYVKIDQLINIHLERRKAPSNSFSSENFRAHETILISGDRGTGKSAVLANLKTYLQKSASKDSGNQRLLILDPVDPTLLDSDHDLLLNIIVAAIIRDASVAKRLAQNDDAAQEFYASLHKLGAALEVVQTRSEKYGLERLRSFMGNHGLADEINKFFHQTLILMEKDLIILPIDDVDTSLNHAFENLEIVRKYLASNLILPIISGDIKLYHEVIWRDMHGRMLKDSRAEEKEAIIKAKSLAKEYEIKVLPLSRRLAMPKIEEYLRNSNIILVDNRNKKDIKNIISLPNYIAWIEALINERVNGMESSNLKIPIRSLRLLTQLISATRDEIIDIAKYLPSEAISVRRFLFMPTSILPAIDEFSSQLLTANLLTGGPKKRQKNLAFKSIYALAETKNYALSSKNKEWANILIEYFKSQHDAGAPYLVISTWIEWMNASRQNSETKTEESMRVLNLPLFMPNMHHAFEEFEQMHELGPSWRKQISEKNAPESWINNLPNKAILPYPLPELGRQMSALGRTTLSGNQTLDDSVELLRLIMTHRNFYSRSEKTIMVFCGRLFEIVVSSFVFELTIKDIQLILNDHPFYSLTMLANTKTLEFNSEDDESTPSDQLDRERENKSLPFNSITLLQKNIQAWRRKHKITVPHPWIFYNVMNKFFNQVSIFNPRENRNNSQGSIMEMVTTAEKAFNALWATFGSFEKGPIFGFDTTIAYQNIGPGEFTRSPLYYANISSLSDLPTIMGSYTQALATHPLKILISQIRTELISIAAMEKSKNKKDNGHKIGP